ncbi:MAG: Lrp/AsnC family transcriptional regulator, partial [Acidimicrobiales bacterium]
MRFDHTDQALVRHLQSRARMTNRALAAAVGLAPSSTLARVRELEHSNVIRGYHADVDLGHL